MGAAAMDINSRIPGFYQRTIEERRAALAEQIRVEKAELENCLHKGLPTELADKMIENVVGVYALPIAVGLNLRLNGRDYLVPMVVEEPSVVAAMSNAAKMVRDGGGFTAEADDPITTVQIQLWDVKDPEKAARAVRENAKALMDAANAAFPQIVDLGGGARDIETFDRGEGLFVVHLHVDVRDAMGANMVNTMAESISDRVGEITGGRVGLRILTNLMERRCIRVKGAAPAASLATESFSGEEVRDRVVEASIFAERDPYRATTHNKGIMNGVDPVVIATGNDWRAVEAGAHAYASRTGSYRPLATWRKRADGALEGQMTIPLALGIVGGTIKVHPGAAMALRLVHAKTARELAMVAAAAGLASNLAALRALATEGIQRGHMALHARSVAASVGATGDEVQKVADAIVAARNITAPAAKEVLEKLRRS
jgi:hydroxymethylglutaryl-CoA reductase